MINGEVLQYALGAGMRPLFLNLGMQCETAVLSYAAPSKSVDSVEAGASAFPSEGGYMFMGHPGQRR